MKNDGLGTYETCSLCCEEVLWRAMRETDAGILCPACFAEGVR